MKTNPAKTRKIFPVLMILLFLLAALVPAFAAKKERKVSHFTELEVSSAFKVVLTQGNTEKLVIESGDIDMSQIITEVKGSKLIIRLKNSTFSRQNRDIRIYITFTTLTDIDVSGAVELKGTNTMNFNDLKVEGSGASSISLNISAKKLNLELSGASTAALAGQTGSFDIEISGASKLDAFDVKAKICNIDVSGASSAKVNVADKLKVEGSGASNVQYKGNPTTVESDLSGSATVNKA